MNQPTNGQTTIAYIEADDCYSVEPLNHPNEED